MSLVSQMAGRNYWVKSEVLAMAQTADSKIDEEKHVVIIDLLRQKWFKRENQKQIAVRGWLNRTSSEPIGVNIVLHIRVRMPDSPPQSLGPKAFVLSRPSHRDSSSERKAKRDCQPRLAVHNR